MLYYVYKVTNRLNDKIYIGKRRNSNPHVDSYMGSGKLIKAAIAKYGIGNFSKEILGIFETDQEAAQFEASLVTKEFANREDTYNLHEGGMGGFHHINDGSKEHRDRSSRGGLIAGGTKNWSEESFRKAKERLQKNVDLGLTSGWIHKEETKEIMSTKKMGSNNPNFGKKWHNNGLQNFLVSVQYGIENNLILGRIC